MLPTQPTFLLSFGFAALSILLGLFWIWAVGRSARPQSRRPLLWAGLLLMVYFAGTAVAAKLDVLHDFRPFPPPVLRLMMPCLLATILVAFSPIGRRLATELPLSILVGFQAFRIPVELLLHRGFEEGLVPVQMTYLGRNFDVIAGLSALILGLYISRRRPAYLRLVLGAWNILCLGLLLNIVTIAILSMPTRLRAFDIEPANVFVAFAPFIWLPTVLVASALFGHLLLFRRLSAGLDSA